MKALFRHPTPHLWLIWTRKYEKSFPRVGVNKNRAVYSVWTQMATSLSIMKLAAATMSPKFSDYWDNGKWCMYVNYFKSYICYQIVHRHLDHQHHRTKTVNLRVPSLGTGPLSGWTASAVSEGQKVQKPHLGHGEGEDCIEINTFRVSFFLSKYFHWRKTSFWQTYKWFHTRFSNWMCAFFWNLPNLIL